MNALVRHRRWILAVIAAVIIAASLTIGQERARADGLDDLCKTVPAPVRPDYQVSGLVMDKPDLKTVPNAAPNPFKDKTVPISDVYGWAWRFTNYDLGCGNDFIRDPSAVATTASANFVMAWMDTLTSWLASMENMAHSGVFDWLHGVVTSVADILQSRVLTIWLPLAAVLLSIVVVFTSARAGYAATMRRVGMLIGSIVLAVLTLVLPKQAMALGSEAVETAAGVAQAGFTTNAADLVTREAIYKTWLVGNFGSAESPTAQEYGPRLLSALTYTWSDVKRMDADPGAKAKIDKAKETEFKTIATEVEKKDPTAYASLTGKTDTRTAPATMGVVWVVLMGLFVAISSFIIVMAKLIMLGLVLYGMVAPVVGVLKFAALQKVWDLFTAAVLNVVKFTVAAGLMTLILSALSTAPVGVGWRMLLAIIATVIALMLTRPIKSFKAMAGMDPNRSLIGSALRRVVGTAIGTVLGSKVASDNAGKATPEQAGETTAPDEGASPNVPQPVEPSYPPLPAPRPLHALPVGSGAEQQPEDVRTSAWAGYTAVDGRYRPADPALAGSPQTFGLPTHQRPHRALPAGAPTSTPQVTAAETAAAVAAAAASDRTRPAFALNETSDERPTVVESDTSVQHPPARPASASTGQAPSSVVYPTGIIVQADPGLYRSSGSAALREGEQYHRFAEPQVDATGQETWEPIYHAEKAGV